MKYFKILGVHWKSRLLARRRSSKTNIERGLPKKGDLDSLPIKEGLGKKEEAGVL